MLVVAGVSGHVGAVVATELLEKGEQIRVIVRDAKKATPFAQRGAEVAVGDLAEPAFLTGALKGASGFFTLLPPNYQVSSFLAFQRQTADAIAAAVKASEVPHVVMLSSLGADLESGTGLIGLLHYLENALRATGTRLTAIRASYFQENVATLGPVRETGVFPSLLPADYKFPQAATLDIGRVAAEALRSPPQKSEVIDLIGPLYSQRQAAEKLGRAVGKTITVIEVPREGWVPGLQQAGLSKELAELFAEMYDAFAKGRVSPKGDRTVVVKTPLEDTLARLLR
jgi:uncharacterized protein YbjT (DUF2867 family)